MGQKRYEMSDEQWEQIKDMFYHSKMGRPPKDDRLMLNAILWIARSGARWSDLPERFGFYKTVCSRFFKWRDDGTLYRIFRKLNTKAEMKELNLDSTSIKAHPQSAGAKKGSVNAENRQYIGRSRSAVWNTQKQAAAMARKRLTTSSYALFHTMEHRKGQHLLSEELIE